MSIKCRVCISLIVIAVTTFIQIQRLLFIPLTWDEGLTYVYYVARFFHSGDQIGGLMLWLDGEIPCVANNHLLNTFLIGITELVTGTRFNAVVIRFPIFVFWVIYVCICTKQFIEGKISSLAYILLMCCSYVNEFFALARGYGYSVTMITVALFSYKKWLSDNKDTSIICSFYALLIAESANTAALLVTAAVAIVFLIKIISEKNFLTYIKRLWIPITIWTVLQLSMVVYHLLITKYDGSLYNDKTGGVKSFIVNIISLPLRERSITRILELLILILIIVNTFVIIKGKKVVYDYPFCSIMLSYVCICFASVQILKNFSDHVGYPMGRVMIMVYPVYVLAIEELIMNGFFTILNATNLKKVFEYVLVAGSVVVLILFLTNTNYKESTDWPTAALYKSAAYEVYESNGEKNIDYLQTINTNLDAFRYWQQKILYETGYDIFNAGD